MTLEDVREYEVLDEVCDYITMNFRISPVDLDSMEKSRVMKLRSRISERDKQYNKSIRNLV